MPGGGSRKRTRLDVWPLPMTPIQRPSGAASTCARPWNQSSVDGRVARHAREQGVGAALAREHGAPQVELLLAERVGGHGRLDDPALTLELALELSGGPARVAGEDPRALPRRRSV